MWRMPPSNESESQLKSEIVALIKSLPERLRGIGGDTSWTKFLKDEMLSLGRKHGHLVVPNENEKQWLYDLVWFTNDQDGRLQEVTLVLESEWSTSDDWHIQEDFEKLLLAKAKLKVFIFQGHSNNFQRIWLLLHEGIRAFKNQSSDETYILAGLKTDAHEFEVQTTPANG